MKNKGGQFYLIFAIIVMGLVTGLLALQNYVVKGDVSEVNQIKEELQIESQNLMDYVLNTGDSSAINSFTQEFSEHVGNYEIIYAIEYDSNLDVFNYQNNAKNSFSSGTDYLVNGNNLTINFNNASYLFNLKEGDDFYFIVSKKEGNENYVATNSE